MFVPTSAAPSRALLLLALACALNAAVAAPVAPADAAVRSLGQPRRQAHAVPGAELAPRSALVLAPKERELGGYSRYKGVQ